MSDMVGTMLILKLNNMVDEAVRNFESERQARLSAETKLRELQKELSSYAVNAGNKYVLQFNACPGDLIFEAIQESRTRRQNDDTTI